MPPREVVDSLRWWIKTVSFCLVLGGVVYRGLSSRAFPFPSVYPAQSVTGEAGFGESDKSAEYTPFPDSVLAALLGVSTRMERALPELLLVRVAERAERRVRVDMGLESSEACVSTTFGVAGVDPVRVEGASMS